MATSNPSRAIVVEGKTDLHVVLHLLEKNNPEMSCKRIDNKTFVAQLSEENNLQLNICQEGGFDRLCDEIEAWLRLSKLKCVGFVFDANSNPKRNWQRVRSRILKTYEELKIVSSSNLRRILRETPVSEGVWIGDCNPKVGMWMMPNNKDTGAIEEFLTYMIHLKDHYWKHAQDYVETILQEGKQFPERKTIKEKNISKANIHAWLAVQEEPGNPPGTAIEAGYFDAESVKVQPFRQWLRNLP